MQEVQNACPDIEAGASVLADIDSLPRAMVYQASGAQVITPDTAINRDLELLRDIKTKTNLKIKLMVNEGCLYRCPFRKFHFNYISHKSRSSNFNYDEFVTGNNLFLGNCCGIIKWDNSQVIKSGWIRPEDLRRYSGIANRFKIVGRTVESNILVKIVDAYLQENWGGNLFDLMCSSLKTFSTGYGAYINNKALDIHDFFDRVSKCKHACDECNYCQSLVHELLIFQGGKILSR
jgi:collagenase-like PrtC family protease